MLVGALAIFTLVAIMGLMMVKDVWAGRPIEAFYPLMHGAAALLGSALVIVVALSGDSGVYINIGLAVIIIALGVFMGMQAKKGKPSPKGVIVAHAGLAVICYVLLALYAFK